VTYTCNVSDDERQAAWEVDGMMINSNTRLQFERLGIFTEEQTGTVANLMVTSAASRRYHFFSIESKIVVRCLASNATSIIAAGPRFIRFFGM
jgi:hypothetical protein